MKKINLFLDLYGNKNINQGIVSLITSFYITKKIRNFYIKFLPQYEKYKGVKRIIYISSVFLSTIIGGLIVDSLTFTGKEFIREGVREIKEKYETDEEEK